MLDALCVVLYDLAVRRLIDGGRELRGVNPEGAELGVALGEGAQRVHHDGQPRVPVRVLRALPLQLRRQVRAGQVAVVVLLIHVERVRVVPSHESLLACLLNRLKRCAQEKRRTRG